MDRGRGPCRPDLIGRGGTTPESIPRDRIHEVIRQPHLRPAIAAVAVGPGCGGDEEYKGPVTPPGESVVEKALKKAEDDKKAGG